MSHTVSTGGISSTLNLCNVTEKTCEADDKATKTDKCISQNDII